MRQPIAIGLTIDPESIPVGGTYIDGYLAGRRDAQCVPRRVRGRPRNPYKQIPLSELGADTDEAIAIRNGVLTETVRKQRLELGIAACGRKNKPKRSSILYEIPENEFCESSDTALAIKYNFTNERVRQVRAMRKIQKFIRQSTLPLKCEMCGTDFLPNFAQGDNYCSQVCRRDHHRKARMKPCRTCGKLFWKRQLNRTDTCSKKCASVLMSKSHGGTGVVGVRCYQVRECPTCGKEHRGRNATCSRECGNKYRTKKRAEVVMTKKNLKPTAVSL